MGMGFVLPFALVFVAIPLETFVHSLRTVVGLIGIAVLHTLALVLRVLGNELATSVPACRVYDLPLFGPLWIETRILAGSDNDHSTASAAAGDERKSWKEARS